MAAQTSTEAADRAGRSAPVFFDARGRRWRRILAATGLGFLTVTAVAVPLTVSAVRPLWTMPEHRDSRYPAQLLSESSSHTIPVIGDEGVDDLARVDLVQRRAGKTYLTDPFTGRVIRTATADEAQTIGTRPYVMEWYGHPAAHQLVLTFDDGPDPRNTPKILDILDRAHVRATFFVVGQNAARNPAIVNREIREGHVVGNHTLTHTVAGHGSVLDREELIGDDRIIRAVAGYATRLFRMPYGDPDDNPLMVLEAQQLGYIVVDLDLDTHDWQYKPGQNIPLPKLDGKGHVVLMHDGGADRAATIRLLPRLIAEARAAGYTFTTITSLVPAEYVPRHVAPSVADRFTQYSAWAILVLPWDVVTWLFWFGVGSLTFMSLNYLVLALVNQHRQSRRAWPQVPGTSVLMTVVLPAYNEEKVLAKTLEALARTDYPRFEIVAVDDGSSDDTWGVLTDFASVWPRLRVFRQETNGGKAAAMNYAIARARGEVIVTLDGDTVFEPQTIGMLARHFVDPRIGVVAGQVKVGNRRNVLTAWQSLEYISGIGVTRMAEGLVGAITVAPGACAAWRKRAIEEAGGYSLAVLADDCDLTLRMHRLGYKVILDNEAIAWTEAPMTVRALARQRLRWTFGILQALRHHRGMVLRPRYGVLGMVVLPYALLSIIIPLVFMPLTYLAAGLVIASGRWQPVALFAAFIFGIQLVTSIVAVRMVRERLWHLLLVPVYRVIYEPLRVYVLYRSLLMVAKGKAVGWFRVPRTNTVEAEGKALPAVHAAGFGLTRGIQRRFS
jgi:cellulose synthase/poly-beta-1,6-N-acetylglucosamine synthase-like glycosyltransferase/peptidoglycan/xylan/chitin deacetylase (PgdA/CDA1 family)